jgi:hypothetical protein
MRRSRWRICPPGGEHVSIKDFSTLRADAMAEPEIGTLDKVGFDRDPIAFRIPNFFTSSADGYETAQGFGE